MRYFLWIGSAALLILAVSTGAWLFDRWLDGKVLLCNYKKIEFGMTLEEVEALLGQGEDTNFIPIDAPPCDKFIRWGNWHDRKFIYVGLKDGKVRYKWFHDVNVL